MKISVAFYLPSLDAGGIERVVLNLLLHLDRARFRPVLILQRKEGLLLQQVPADVEVRTLGGARALIAAPHLASQLRDCGARVVYSGTNAANIPAILASELLRRRVAAVASEHTPPSIFLAEAKWGVVRLAAMRAMYPRAATIAVPLAEVGEDLRRILRRPALSISVLPNPVFDDAIFSLKEDAPEIALPEGKVPLLVSSGRLVKAKGFDILLEAFALLKPSPRPPTLILLGEGPERQELESLAGSLGVADRVRFAGNVRNPFAILSRAFAMVLSSRREGFGNVLVEAMACGVPVVASDCPFGPRAILRGGQVGVLVPPENPGALASGIERLLGDPGLAAELSARGRDAASEYSVERTVPRFESLFEELASR